MLRRFNDLPIFDLSRIPGREWIARILGCLAAGAFLARMILQMPAMPGYIREFRWAHAGFAALTFLPKSLVATPFDLDQAYSAIYSHDQIRILWALLFLLWFFESAVFLWYIVALATRAPAVSVARGFMQAVFPFLVTLFPILTVMTEHNFLQWFTGHPQNLLKAMFALYSALVAAGAVSLAGLIALRRAFTITSEARVFIRTGIYRFIRHPLYASYFVIYLCYTALHIHPVTLAYYFVFAIGQTLRARIEERKLTEAFPEYEDYRRSTGMFFPRLWKRVPAPSAAAR